MRIIVGADHAGFPLKGPVVEALRAWGHEVEDVGTHDGQPVDFPDVARRVCDPVRTARRIGASWSAGPASARRWRRTSCPASARRSATTSTRRTSAWSTTTPTSSASGAQIVGDRLALDLLKAYLRAEFSTEEHFRRRVRKLAQMEQDAADELRAVGSRQRAAGS